MSIRILKKTIKFKNCTRSEVVIVPNCFSNGTLFYTSILNILIGYEIPFARMKYFLFNSRNTAKIILGRFSQP